MGTTPFSYSDTKIVGSSTAIGLELEGYESFNTMLVRSEQPDVGAIIGGIFVLIPFLWTMGYSPSHMYDLFPVSSQKTITQPPPVTSQPPQATPPPTPPPGQSLSNDQLDRLVKLKKLYDDKVLTKEEFEREKQKILDQK